MVAIEVGLLTKINPKFFGQWEKFKTQGKFTGEVAQLDLSKAGETTSFGGDFGQQAFDLGHVPLSHISWRQGGFCLGAGILKSLQELLPAS